MTYDAEHASDVMNEDEIVHVPEGVVDLAESLEHHGETFIADVPDWDAPDFDAPAPQTDAASG